MTKTKKRLLALLAVLFAWALPVRERKPRSEPWRWRRPIPSAMS